MLLSDLGLPSNLTVWLAALLLGLSLFIGLLGGLIGLSLGTMRLPAMLMLGVPLPVAASANIFVSSVVGVSGSYRHFRDGRVKLRLVFIIGIPAFVSGFLGGFFSNQAPTNLLIALAGVLILWQGIELVLLAHRRRRDAHGDEPPDDQLEGSAGHFTVARTVGGAGASFGIGLLAGAIGLVLGSVRLPLIIRVLRVDPRIAAGSNLFIGMTMAALGWLGHMLHTRPDLALLIILLGPAVVGSYMGAKFTGWISVNLLLLVMGTLLTASGCMMLWRAVSSVL
jgi:uncharacterized membrane protein YfcA